MASAAAPEPIKCDLAIVGGGLAGGLIALAVARQRPEIKLTLIDQSAHFGGNHIWSYFASDIAPGHRWLTAPLVTYGWSGYDVRFSEHCRRYDSLYYSLESERLDWLLRHTLPNESLITGREVKAVSPRLVVLEGAQRINAGGVIDARGLAELHHLDCGWKKFGGQLLQLADPHNLTRPIIMDASVDQHDGFRYTYVLPFGMDKMFIEDVYYSDRPDLDTKTINGRIAAYAANKGWHVDRVLRDESGVLPVIMGGDLENYWASGSGRTAKAGMRGCFYHGLTGNSLPDAVRLAVEVAALPDFDGDRLNMLLRQRADAHWNDAKFDRLLARMMYRNTASGDRRKLFEHIHKQKPALVARFYAGQTTGGDRARILSIKPTFMGKVVNAFKMRKQVRS